MATAFQHYDHADHEREMVRSAALGTAWGQVTYAMHCIREGSPERAMEALATGKAAITEACPNLRDFWESFQPERENV